MTQVSTSSVAGDAPSVVVLVGRTGLDAALRLDPSIELVRVKTASEAIAAVATESAARAEVPTPMAVIVSEEVRDGLSVHDQSGVTGQQRFTRVLRNLRPGIEVMFLGEDGVTADAIAQAARGGSRAETQVEAGASEAAPQSAFAAPGVVAEVPAQVAAQAQIAAPAQPAMQASGGAMVPPRAILDDGAPGVLEPVAPPTRVGEVGFVGAPVAPSMPVLAAPPLGGPEAPVQTPRVEVVAPLATTGLAAAGLSAGSGLSSVQPPVVVAPARVQALASEQAGQAVGTVSASQPSVQSSGQGLARGILTPPLAPPAVASAAALGALAELGAPALFGVRKEDASLEIGPGSPGDALLVRTLLRGQDVQGVAMELLRARASDSSLEVVPEPAQGRLSVPLGDGAGWLTSARAERADQLRAHAAWLAGWLRLRDQQAVLADAALKDALTGAWNRRYLDAFLASALRSARDARQFVTVLLFDIDNFKSFNDRHGHDAGDAILREVVELMRSMVRPSDRVCRVGGDEFAVVFHDPQGPRQLGSRHPSTVEDIAQRFQQRVASHSFSRLQAGTKLTISGGLATFPWDGLHAADLLAHADQLSLASKRAGKNAIVLGG